MRSASWRLWIAAGVIASLAAGCQPRRSAAEQVYVKPGDYDKFYAFLSGGHAGQIYVYGLPSGRMLNVIPVFSNYPKSGYGFDDASRKLMGGYDWGDCHHPALSKTRGDYDGRWLFINDMPHSRLARIDLTDFQTKEIFGPVPNVSALHAGPFITSDSEYAFGPSRFSAPLDWKQYQPIDSYAKTYDGVIAAIKIAPDTGRMTLDYEVLTPPMDLDLGATGKGPSNDWAFFTSYNTELAHTDLEVTSAQHDQDFIVALNWRAAAKAAAGGAGTMFNGARVIDPAKTPGLVYFIPTPKNPHGVDVSPDGRWIVASSKLAPVATVFDFTAFTRAIEQRDFDGSWRGVPVIKARTVTVSQVPVGLGPLHTQFDDKGYAYTSLFVDSAITKWQLGSWKVVDKIPITYNIGHLSVIGGDTVHPFGTYMLALNKMTKDRFLLTGPVYPTNAQLIDITGEKMQLLLDFPTMGEPHYAQIIPASKLKVAKIYDLAKNSDPNAAKTEAQAGVTRNGNQVTVKMTQIRSHFTPDNLTFQQGDRVTFHVTNLEQDENVAHGFAIDFSNIDVEVAPGETKTVTWVADTPGVYPFYCSNFCSALHQEMQGYLAVQPRR